MVQGTNAGEKVRTQAPSKEQAEAEAKLAKEDLAQQQAEVAQDATEGDEPSEDDSAEDESESEPAGEDGGPSEGPAEVPAPAGHVEGDADSVKAKMREALERKKSQQHGGGAAGGSKVKGPHGAASAGSQRRVFRRKSG